MSLVPALQCYAPKGSRSKACECFEATLFRGRLENQLPILWAPPSPILRQAQAGVCGALLETPAICNLWLIH